MYMCVSPTPGMFLCSPHRRVDAPNVWQVSDSGIGFNIHILYWLFLIIGLIMAESSPHFAPGELVSTSISGGTGSLAILARYLDIIRLVVLTGDAVRLVCPVYGYIEPQHPAHQNIEFKGYPADAAMQSAAQAA